MRSVLQRNRWITMIMVAVFLLASSGTMLSRMTCLIGGHSELSIGLVDDCCPEEATDGPSISATCCATSATRSDLQDYLPNADLILQPVIAVVGQTWSIMGPVMQGSNIAWCDTRPPPISGFDRLMAFSVQRV
jgi:hypothetical protein